MSNTSPGQRVIFTLTVAEKILLQNALGVYAREPGFKHATELKPQMTELRLKLKALIDADDYTAVRPTRLEVLPC